jgi:peptide chain release factor 2
LRRRGGYFDQDRKRSDLAALDEQIARPDFWKNQEEAKRVSQRAGALRTELTEWDAFEAEAKDAFELAKLAEESKDKELLAEAEKKIGELTKKFEHLEFYVLLSGKFDQSNALVAIHAGTGGTEAQDWAEMLTRMYLRYAERRGFTARIVDEHKGAEAGVKSVTISIEGPYAYGYFKSEHGVHRLVRISPFDAEKMRHTSFALVEVLPEIPEDESLKIDPKDIRIDTYLSSGHGGQSVQTTYSAIRIVHIPTGITVTCQNERSQQQNKETAMKVLRARLLARREAERKSEREEIRGEYHEAEWGNQIRSYVVHPYKLVKDHRTKFESQDTVAILNGEIEPFVESFLKWSRGRHGVSAPEAHK